MNGRLVPWVQRIPAGFDELIEIAQNLKLFQVGEIGPSHFQYKDEEGGKYRVQISSTITCTCSFKKINSHCVHSLFVILKKFRANPENPIVWQGSYLGSEIDDLINIKFAAQNKSTNVRQAYLQSRAGIKKVQKEMNNAKQSNRQIIDAESICPICQDEMKEDEPLTYCRKKCGNNFHIKCLRVWIDHKLGSGDRITCPMCRTDITSGIFDDIRKDEDAYNVRYVTHVGKRCQACQKKNVLGNLYHCLTCENLDLCHFCYHDNQHPHHTKFLLKRRKDTPWEIPEKPRQPKSHSSPMLPFLTTESSTTTSHQKRPPYKPNSTTVSQAPPPQTICDLHDYFISCFSLFKDIQQEQQVSQHPSGLSIIGQEMNKNKNTCSACCKSDVQSLMRKLNCGHAIHTNCLKDSFVKSQFPHCNTCSVPLLFGYNSTKSAVEAKEKQEQKSKPQGETQLKSVSNQRKRSLQHEPTTTTTTTAAALVGEKVEILGENNQDLQIGGTASVPNIRKPNNFRIKKGLPPAVPIPVPGVGILPNQIQIKSTLSNYEKRRAFLARAQEHKENVQALVITGELQLFGREIAGQQIRSERDHLHQQQQQQQLQQQQNNFPQTMIARPKIILPSQKDKKSGVIVNSKNRRKITETRNQNPQLINPIFDVTISGQQIARVEDSNQFIGWVNQNEDAYYDAHIEQQQDDQLEEESKNQFDSFSREEQNQQHHQYLEMRQQLNEYPHNYNFTRENHMEDQHYSNYQDAYDHEERDDDIDEYYE